ncbi:hypothetical protein TWF694_011219 [Orbilia ellipsospora]|uniref:C2H2-type domain-containing protein n=1 Tax=Orbilia ellipsospora TaxID=2528407 RepID=A0AAV9X8G2_9PEZI
METASFWQQNYPNGVSHFNHHSRSRIVDVGEHKLSLPIQTIPQRPIERFNSGENALPMGLVPNPVSGYAGMNAGSLQSLTFTQMEADSQSWHSSMHEDDQRSLSADSSSSVSSTHNAASGWGQESPSMSHYRSNSIPLAFQDSSAPPETAYYFKSPTEVIDPNLTLNNQDQDFYFKEPTIKFEFSCFAPLDDGEYENEPYSPESPTGTHYAPYELERNHTVHQPLPSFNSNWGTRKVPVTRSQAQNESRNQSHSKGSSNGASRSNRLPKTPLSPTSRKIDRRRGSSSSSEEAPAKPNNRPKTYKRKVPFYLCEEDICKTKGTPFKNKSELKKHIETQHTKPYICICGFADCNQRFGARNEWKRHIATQHLMLYKYICDHPDCVEKNKAKTIFNRGDLFMKHQERMHSPLDLHDRSPNDLELIAWKKEMKDAKTRCETLRPPPQRMTCGFCSDVFEHGDRTWQELIDHVGLHYQANDPSVQNGYKDDLDLMAWMKHHNLIKDEDDDSMDLDSETPTSRKSRKRSSTSSSTSHRSRQIKQEHMDF